MVYWGIVAAGWIVAALCFRFAWRVSRNALRMWAEHEAFVADGEKLRDSLRQQVSLWKKQSAAMTEEVRQLQAKLEHQKTLSAERKAALRQEHQREMSILRGELSQDIQHVKEFNATLEYENKRLHAELTRKAMPKRKAPKKKAPKKKAPKKKAPKKKAPRKRGGRQPQSRTKRGRRR